MSPSNIFSESIFAFSKRLWLKSYTNEISYSGSPEFYLHSSNVNINISAGKVINDQPSYDTVNDNHKRESEKREQTEVGHQEGQC